MTVHGDKIYIRDGIVYAGELRKPIKDQRAESLPDKMIIAEEELWGHIDHSLQQAKAGEGQDADKVIDRLKKEFAL